MGTSREGGGKQDPFLFQKMIIQSGIYVPERFHEEVECCKFQNLVPLFCNVS